MLARRRSAGSWAGLLAAALLGCVPARRPPLATTARVAPRPDVPPPPPAGYGRVIIDVVDGPARVDLPDVGSDDLAWRRPLCVSPCVLDLPQGRHQLRLTLTDRDDHRTELALVNFRSMPTVYRRAMGWEDR